MTARDVREGAYFFGRRNVVKPDAAFPKIFFDVREGLLRLGVRAKRPLHQPQGGQPRPRSSSPWKIGLLVFMEETAGAKPRAKKVLYPDDVHG